ncbi:AraC family transcriptional regulator [Dyadobacter arcticus]|uniref:AraC-like DNA-binding protein n=1 Tax=Dyadobacter arcticus TaxID=1078754 RepID=A0ABX0UKX6_9BACT|nr:AraC family transcriptional regulator [Dyadobacter arcticus]NIJ53621.1 AraC-like DNA-binding protein [Dyadobacter arcticus]
MKEILHEPFEIIYIELDECPKSDHQHNFFELVYIISGTGTQVINDNTFQYHPGHMFLITPEDTHSFDIETTTRFFFIRFNGVYIRRNASLVAASQHNDQLQRLEFILQNANHQPGCILKNQTDKSIIKPLVDAIIREYVNRDLYNKDLIQHYVNTMIILVARNIAKYLPEKINACTDEKALDILQYIQQNIYHPDKIKAGYISKHFGISESYLGRYFKKQTNETMQEYIISSRLKLVETRLLHSNLRMNEIADELSFTDESHMNRFFKKSKGMSLGEFRRKNQSASAV